MNPSLFPETPESTWWMVRGDAYPIAVPAWWAAENCARFPIRLGTYADVAPKAPEAVKPREEAA